MNLEWPDWWRTATGKFDARFLKLEEDGFRLHIPRLSKEIVWGISMLKSKEQWGAWVEYSGGPSRWLGFYATPEEAVQSVSDELDCVRVELNRVRKYDPF